MHVLGGVAVAGILSTPSVFAQQAAEPEKPKWETTANAGLTLTTGNSESILGTIGLDTKRKWESDEVTLGASAGYGKSSSPGTTRSRTTDFTKAYGQYNHLINERAYFGLRVDGERDGIADLSYRVRISPLLGYYVIKNDKTSLSFDVGPSVVIERFEATPANVNPTTDTYLAIRFGERFEHKLSDTTKIWQTAEYIPSVKEWSEKYLINAEIGISTAITPKWDLQLKYQINHDSAPAGNREYTDSRLIAGTAYKF